jgi:hypothetical protein
MEKKKSRHQTHLPVGPIFMLLCSILSLDLRAEGQTLDFSRTKYMSVGFTYSFTWGKLNAHALGPEISIGYVYDDPFIVSMTTGAQLYVNSRGWSGYLKANGGTYMLGGSFGLSLNSIDNRIRPGVESDIWAGGLAYGMVSYRLIPGYSGISASGKIKVPQIIH